MSIQSNFDSNKTGILLISHGSRLPVASETINKLADMYREQTDFKINVGYMEIREPNIPTALDELVEGTEIDTVIAVPVFLAHGIHTTRDIPKILRLIDDEKDDNEKHNHSKHNYPEYDHSKHNHEDKQHDKHKHHHHHHHHDIEKINFDGKIIYTEPLGADSLVLEIIKNRVNGAMKE